LYIASLAGQNAGAQLLSGGDGKDTTLPKGEFGVKLGGNMQKITGTFWKSDYSLGINGGIFAGMHKNKWGGRIEVLAATARIKTDSLTDSLGINKGDFQLVTLEIPVLVEYSPVPGFMIQAGVQYSSLLSVKNLSDVNGEIKKLFKQGEFSGVIGLEVNLPYNLSVGGRYRYGFTNINNEDVSGNSEKWNTQAFQLYVCYKIK